MEWLPPIKCAPSALAAPLLRSTLDGHSDAPFLRHGRTRRWLTLV